jgi:hypothetical protein
MREHPRPPVPLRVAGFRSRHDRLHSRDVVPPARLGRGGARRRFWSCHSCRFPGSPGALQTARENSFIPRPGPICQPLSPFWLRCSEKAPAFFVFCAPCGFAHVPASRATSQGQSFLQAQRRDDGDCLRDASTTLIRTSTTPRTRCIFTITCTDDDRLRRKRCKAQRDA